MTTDTHSTGDGTGANSFRLAHLSDPHLTSLQGVHWWELLNKRILGYLSWRIRRRGEHRPEILSALETDLHSQHPDHIVVTGDLTHVGTPGECRDAARWLARFGPPSLITVIPGNHDRYAPAEWSTTVGQWHEYMRGDETPPGASSMALFPTLRRRGPVALIGLCTALPTAPFFASGRIGRAQLEGLAALLDQTGRLGLFRTVLLHHGPFIRETGRRRGLNDADDFLEILRQQRPELVLHGHGHRPVHRRLEAHETFSPVFGVASASARGSVPAKRAGYNIYEIAATARGWRLNVRERVHDSASGAFIDGPGQSMNIERVATAPAEANHA